MAGVVHIIGAGLAGLAAAVRLSQAGHAVCIHEAAPQAGGRCRSYYDAALGLTIDNGNHLLLSGNRDALDYLAVIGAKDALRGPEEACFPFMDLVTGKRWDLRPNDGRIPWWIFAPSRRVPDSSALDYRAPLGIMLSRRDQRIDRVMSCSGPLYDRLWGPVLLAGLNTPPEQGSTSLAAAMIRESLMAGGQMCRPLIATHGLSAAFVDPAILLLGKAGHSIRFGRRLRSLGITDGRVTCLAFADGEEAL
ncbi:MAG: FAD-dependent oxidoreductase, partial [Beijerinckiaceae bacterium]